MNTVEKRLLSLQQQVQQLNIDVSTLIALASSNHSGTNRTNVTSAISQLTSPKTGLLEKSNVGINRYRQLQTGEQTDHTNDHPARHLSRTRQE